MPNLPPGARAGPRKVSPRPCQPTLSTAARPSTWFWATPVSTTGQYLHARPSESSSWYLPE